MAMELMMDFAIIFSALNVALLLVLLYFYGRIAVRTGAAHSVGLVFFALSLLANSVVTVYSYAAMAPLFGADALPFLASMSVLQFVGLTVLLKITL